MSIADKFMEVARTKLDSATFDSIYTAAVQAERRRIEAIPAYPTAEQPDKPRVAERLTAEINDLPRDADVPHVVLRMDERLDLEITKNDLAELQQMLRNNDKNVRVIKRRMDAIHECEVTYRGRHFTVIYNHSRNLLITAYLKKKKRPRKIRVGKAHQNSPRNWRQLVAQDVDEMDES